MPNRKTSHWTEWGSPGSPDAGKPPAAELLAQAGRRIREARLSRGMSIKELAFAAGINPSFLSYVETGRKAPSLDTLVRLAEALGIALPRLFGAGSRKRNTGERCLGAFLRIVSWSSRKEKVRYCEILNAYAKLVRNRTVERRTGMLNGASALLYALRRARVN